MNRKMLLPPLGLLLVAGMILPAIAPARAAVLPLKVSADNLDEATTAELTKAIADKFARYPSLTLLPMPEADAIARAMADPAVARWLEGRTVVKRIFVPDKLLNIVVKQP